jgi:hypothetical protein
MESLAAKPTCCKVSWLRPIITNDIHPIFRDDNICVCPYKDTYCMAPHFADNPEVLAWRAKAPQTNSPYIEGFKENILVRTIFQLATRMILHDDALPFWQDSWTRWTGILTPLTLRSKYTLADILTRPTRRVPCNATEGGDVGGGPGKSSLFFLTVYHPEIGLSGARV